ncbi:MAG TPA: thiamine pyrophosphate-dependent enzyme, partial [Desulfobacterales bacterium]|nr:thiamine pyrophosphate-dependent enzyme [Desulfobacterales bacterium]
NDPLARFQMRLSQEKLLNQEKTKRIWDEVESELDAAIHFAQESPFPRPEEALDDVFVTV